MLLTVSFILLVGVLNFALGYFTAVWFGAVPTPAKTVPVKPMPAAAANSSSGNPSLGASLAAATALASKPAPLPAAAAEPTPAVDSALAYAPLNAARDECQDYCQSLSSLSDELASSAASGGANAPMLAARAAAVAGQFTPLAQQLRNVTANLAEEHSELSLVCSSLDLTLSGGEDLCQHVANESPDALNGEPTELAAAWQSRLGSLGETAQAVAGQLQEIERMLAAAMNAS